ncbi:hypothetical protein IFM12275_20310 [Nocardia sputorum]|uniref:Uncharacterized protein n=1 Tax=Nocardia sputorum TaxID=2984338 RepID=A0ABM8D007_9NOCA|nr:hypothetical protein IFM12275_20310 [Nocardia sputorum]BDU00658.1 hypothetical protein IFM12276_36860 [Nocardia sputorum]
MVHGVVDGAGRERSSADRDTGERGEHEQGGREEQSGKTAPPHGGKKGHGDELLLKSAIRLLGLVSLTYLSVQTGMAECPPRRATEPIPEEVR